MPPQDRPSPSPFRCYDKEVETEVTERYLPHWFQPGVCIFITFRTADSMPRQVVQQWHHEQNNWLRKNGLSRDAIDDPGTPVRLKQSFLRLRQKTWEQHLDSCHGACVLRRQEVSEIVGITLLSFDGERYDLDSFVVMPNHVHLLVQFRSGWNLKKQCESWLRYSAREINRLLGQRGAFWQSEPFDHLVRSPEQFEYLQKYIADNPSKANIAEGESLLWQRK